MYNYIYTQNYVCVTSEQRGHHCTHLHCGKYGGVGGGTACKANPST